MDNQHQKIIGYRELTQDEIDFINSVKAIGCELESLFDELHAQGSSVDQRWISIGKTHLQQGLMALVRAIAKPESF